MEGTSPPLVASLGVSSHGVGLLEIKFVSNLGEEFVDWFFENHIYPLPYPVLVLTQVFSLLFEWSLTSGGCSRSLFHLLDIVLQPGEHLDPGHEVPKVGWKVERRVFP